MSAITIVADGVSIATSGTSATATLPNTNAGTKPRLIRVAATAAAHVQLFKDGTGTATTADTLVQPGDAVTLVVPAGTNNIAAIQSSAAGVVQVSPLED
ncbi:hypothetical protein [Pseudoduganella chitinolytica]|uniref:DUF2190 family protein n=1 Tax=Pseudoduganella chitinolytica TaxID=34070 RepID=A0ABY8BG34_9BURK|nr:hypothetical protein [Pseudoduganella chitinolytica]WEF34865.1 hypothetical protein PX653_08915 [Pseudoduganella chitinolytica]